MNPKIQSLHSYPFEKLIKLKSGIDPANLDHIALSIGEPKHTPPQFVLDELTRHLGTVANYAATIGSDKLRTTIAEWLEKRFKLKEGSLDKATQVIPVNGTREALFSFAQSVVDESTDAKIVMPNPFYQIYEGAAILAGAEPVFANCTIENNFLSNLDAIPPETWNKTELLFICTPGNPTGAVIPLGQLIDLINLADKYDFSIASDECYSELYFDESSPPTGILQACSEMGNHEYKRCVAFHSLSKRSNLPGLRSGFVAGDAALLKPYLHYRTYHGCAMPLFTQHASIAAWQDEQHVLENRNLYRKKFSAVLSILDGCLDVQMPDASFYLWPKLDMPGTEFTKKLYAQQNITVLPGSFLARDTNEGNPGEDFVRMALVASEAECIDAAHRIKQTVEQL